MREIKFRAWDKNKKKFFSPTYEAYKGKLEEILLNLNGRMSLRIMGRLDDESLFPNRFILMQYTSLKDKNGKEIYEGDIVIPASNEWNEPPYTVEFDGGAFTINRPHTIVKTFWEVGNHWEVIGNIYENPELSKEKR